MKLLLLLALCATAAAAPKIEKENQDTFDPNLIGYDTLDSRNVLVNVLIRQLIEFLRRIINNGWEQQGIPPLDPLNLNEFHLVLPAGLINLDLELEKIHAAGLGQFIVHRSNLNLRDLTFEIDISVPTLDISADKYNLVGDLFTAIPLYGNGGAVFKIDAFRFQTKLYLMQSEDGNSVIIDKIENTSFVVPSLKSDLTGVIGGGDIDAIVNAMAGEVIIDYVNRFQGAIATVASRLAKTLLNPFLNQLDTWRFIAPLLPR